MRDMVSKGRRIFEGKRGELNARSKLTEDQVRRIHRDYSGGVFQRELANEYGVCVDLIKRIISGKLWPHLGLGNAIRKGVHVGERTNNAKLSEEKVKSIRILYSSGLSQSKIAKKYGVSQATISDVLLGKIWSHVR
ncbi:hypothetical protein LCGC14_1550940 [marine sediment metagenome]|uniref:Resolvase HTH domain-containing protein n=1 Tax=marine sediment metagenome TaxID=412755 RepID=A0A0F9LR27_9ZZZZ